MPQRRRKRELGAGEAGLLRSPGKGPGGILGSSLPFLSHRLSAPFLPLTHGLWSLFIAGVHSNFSTTIPPTSWQADLPPHHPSSACSDGTLKLNTAASTEGMGMAERGRERVPLPGRLPQPRAVTFTGELP